jgi:hypothetical protein
MSRERLPLSYRIGKRRIQGETLYLDAGASVLVLTSCFADLGLELRGAYLSAERSDRLLVAESAVLGGEPAELCSRRLDMRELARDEQRRHPLYDHLYSLQDLAARGGSALRFEGVEAAVAELDPHCSV